MSNTLLARTSRPVLVTGASGFAGSHLLDALATAGSPVVAWRRAGRPAPLRPHVAWETIDILDRDAVGRAIARLRPREVYHCAGAAHVGGSWGDATTSLAINVLGTHHLVEALRDHAGDASVLVPSSALVYAPSSRPLREDDPRVPSSPYGISKLAQELIGLAGGGLEAPRIFVARAFNHFGPRQSAAFVGSAFAQQIAEIEAGRSAPQLSVGNLEARRDLTDVRDTVRAYVAIVSRGIAGRPYNVCSGTAVAVRDLLDMLLARARVSIDVTVDPARYRPNDVPLVVGDPSRIAHEVGWTPSIPLSTTVDDLLAYWRSRTAA